MPRRVLVVLLLGALVGATPAPGRGDDRVSVNGAYFRETSTRVVQPMIEVSKDLPSGFDVSAHFLVDVMSGVGYIAFRNHCFLHACIR